jgi:hypothetical protein
VHNPGDTGRRVEFELRTLSATPPPTRRTAQRKRTVRGEIACMWPGCQDKASLGNNPDRFAGLAQRAARIHAATHDPIAVAVVRRVGA